MGMERVPDNLVNFMGPFKSLLPKKGIHSKTHIFKLMIAVTIEATFWETFILFRVLLIIVEKYHSKHKGQNQSVALPMIANLVSIRRNVFIPNKASNKTLVLFHV